MQPLHQLGMKRVPRRMLRFNTWLLHAPAGTMG